MPTCLSLNWGGAPGIVKEIDSGVIVTDVVDVLGVEQVCAAEDMPFEDQSVRAIILKDVLHHLRDVGEFLSEAERVLVSGGAVVAIEPYWGLIARTIYKHAHPEPYEPHASKWGVDGTDRWHSNQAIPYIILRRDRAAFEAAFPAFAIEELGPCIGPSYLLSGGVYSRTVAPSRPLIWMLRAERSIGRILRPVALHTMFAFRKR